jgi:hypothetical protein
MTDDRIAMFELAIQADAVKVAATPSSDWTAINEPHD